MAESRIEICESCLGAVTEAAMMLGEDYDNERRVRLLARASGGDIFGHDCDADDDAGVECNCGCRGG